MEKRLGFIGIIIDDRKASAGEVNNILSEYADMIIARTGVPRGHENRSVMTLIVEATTDEVGALTGKLGNVGSVSVKSALGAVSKT